MNFLLKRLGKPSAIVTYQEVEHSNEFLYMYRSFLKLIPQKYPRKLERYQKLRETQWIFRQLKDEKYPETIQSQRDLGYQVLKMIENDQVLPSFYPNPLDLNDSEFNLTFNKKLYNRMTL